MGHGVYRLLERLGCGFYLSFDTLPCEPPAEFSFDRWAMSDAPLAPVRMVFNWHNFLSGCSTWNVEHWQRWIAQSQKMGYNGGMVHAYGNNPMAGFRFRGRDKPVGYLSSTRVGRDWSTNHVNDVRRLWGGEVFDVQVGASSGRPSVTDRIDVVKLASGRNRVLKRIDDVHLDAPGVVEVRLEPKAAIMKWTREQYVELMTFGEAERPMFSELFGPLVGLDEEWRAQGATEDEIDMVGFDWDYVPYVECGGVCGPFPVSEPTVIEETDRHVLTRDHLGRTCKLCKGTATIPLPLDFPIKGPDDWPALKPCFTYRDDRIDWAAVDRARALQEAGHMVRAEIPGGWDIARELMGEEQACLSYYTQPDLMTDVLQTLTETSVRVLERVTEKVVIDQLFVHEDMAGKSGPLIGPAHVRRFLAPYYRACWEVVSDRGTRLFNLDSDGNMTPVLDAFLECGVNVMHSFEPAAGMDVVEVRTRYADRLAILGGIDKHVLRRSPEEIERELEYKMQPLMRRGTVFSLDHRIPNGTPLENYRYYVRRGREILGLPPLDGHSKGWGRMAF